MLRYAISDRRLFPGEERARQARLIQQAVTLALEGVEYFQIREKDLAEAELLTLTIAVRDAVRATGAAMRIVLNGPAALAAWAGVALHCTSNRQSAGPCWSASVHTLDEIDRQRSRASLLLFGPVFGKTVVGRPVQSGVGLQHLREAVVRAEGAPVFALGGVNLQNAPLCMAEGAAGIAGIRLFLR